MEDCLFCKIIAGKIPSTKLYEDDEMLVFKDIRPEAPVHFLTVPKKHIANMMEASATDADDALLGRLLRRAAIVAAEQGCGENGGRFVINCLQDGLQTVPHLHIHFLGKRKLGWPPG
jgi:histidine triad (HIT) family protein